MNTKKLFKASTHLLFLSCFTIIGNYSYAQNTPRIKSTLTEIHQAVLKDTTWTPGAIVAKIYFIRFDKTGRKLAENSLNENGSANSKIIYIYDKKGRIKEEIAASVNKGGITNIYQYFYDEQGRRNGKHKLDPQRNILSTDTVIRNNAGQVTNRIYNGIVTFKKEQRTQRYQKTVEITYNKEEQTAKVKEESTLNKNETPVIRDLQKKDTAQISLYSEGVFKVYQAPRSKKFHVEYDTYGNWVKRTEYNETIPELIIIRDIQYAEDDTDKDRLLLAGNVKSVRQSSYVAISKGADDIEKGLKKGGFFTTTFDKDGRTIMTEHFSEAGVLKGITEYKYDVTTGNILNEIRKSPTEKIEYTIQWTHDENGLLRKKTMLDTKNEIFRLGKYRYDYEGNCINEMWFNKDASKYCEFQYMYDPYGNMISKQVLVSPPDTQETEFKSVKLFWNTRGRVAEKWIGSPENALHYTYQYSSRGEIVSGTEPSDNNVDVSYIYKFLNDTRDNWKKRIKFINDKPVLYEEREYTYYN